MEHIVQFAVGIDDERIQKIMEESAAKQIADDIKMASHGLRSYYGNELNKEPENLKALFSEEISKYIKENADEIVKLVVAEVSKNMMKTKKIKEAIDSVVGESDNE